MGTDGFGNGPRLTAFGSRGIDEDQVTGVTGHGPESEVVENLRTVANRTAFALEVMDITHHEAIIDT